MNLKSKRLLESAVLLLFVGLWATSAARSFSNFSLTPDSGSYLSATQNLLRTGQLFSYASYFSPGTQPDIFPYTEQPPGLPLFLAPFLAILKQPILAAAAAQAAAIGLLFSAVFSLTRDLELHPGFQAAAGLAFALLIPLVQIYVTFWSETLFIGLSLWSVHFLIRSGSQPARKRLLLLSFLFASAASLTRSIGALILPAFLLALALMERNRWVWIAGALAAVLGPIAAWSLRNRALYGASSFSHTLAGKIFWENIPVPIQYLSGLLSTAGWSSLLLTGLVIGCCAAPVLLSMKHFTGAGLSIRPHRTRSRGGKAVTLVFIAVGLALAAFSLAYDLIGGSGGLGLIQLTGLLLGLSLAAAGWAANTNLVTVLRQVWGRAAGFHDKNPRLTAHLVILTGGLSHLLGIVLMSLVTTFSPLDARLLSPGLAFLMLASLSGFAWIIERLVPKRLALFAAAAGLLLAGASSAFYKSELGFPLTLRIPEEQALWAEVNRLPGLERAGYFVSDDDYLHQIYALRPQGIIYRAPDILKENSLERLAASDACPFILARSNSDLGVFLAERSADLPFQKISLQGGRFDLYASTCLVSGSP